MNESLKLDRTGTTALLDVSGSCNVHCDQQLSLDDLRQQESPISESEIEESSRSVELEHEAFERAFRFISESTLTSVDGLLPSFALKELIIGKVLGRGATSIINEIRGVSLGSTSDLPFPSSNSIASDDKESRYFAAAHCIRPSGDARYAIKRVRGDVLADPERYNATTADLLLEAHFLRHVEHPHIIKLRAASSANPCSKEFFLVLDRLGDTLTKRLVEWKQRKGESALPFVRFLLFRRGLPELMKERIATAYQLSSALKYLHQRNIAHRVRIFPLLSSIEIVL
jgi:serine/threonine protein kinase